MVRHGEAAAGWGAHPDPGLSPLGRAQAQTASAALHALGLTRALSSPMQRCRETATPFVDHSGLQLVIEPRVSEIPTPPGTEDRVAWLQALMAGTWADTPTLIQDWRAALLDAVHALPDGTVVFSHFVAINAVVSSLEEDKRVTVFKPGHCSLTRLERGTGGLRVAERGASIDTKVL